jgi:hypothetical protein
MKNDFFGRKNLAVMSAAAVVAVGPTASNATGVPDTQQDGGNTYSVTLTSGQTQTLPTDRVTQEAFTKASFEDPSGRPRPAMARVAIGDIETCATGGANLLQHSPEVESIQCNGPDGKTVMLEKGQGGQVRRTNFGPGF